jgi:hypothetical protein
MRSSLASLSPLLVALFALAGCGGNVSGATDRDAGPGPGDDANDTPPPDGGPVNPNCPAKSHVSEGLSCSLSGLVCPSSQTVADCTGNAKSLSCFCDGESWTCEQATPQNCPAQVCPAPQTIYPGGNCVSAGLGNECSSANVPYGGCPGTLEQSGTVTATCNCTSSGWSCPLSEPQCPVTPPACPDPSYVFLYGSCSPGMVCPGNPQNCEGTTYFDTFQCQGYWVPVVTTTCAVYEDASAPFPGQDGATFAADAGGDTFE